MKTSAVVIQDSISPDMKRLTSLEVCFPRLILAEVNTHRLLSRNYRSSRAVPVKKLIEEVRTDPFIPSQFTRNQAGMQGGDPLEGEALQLAEDGWRKAAACAADWAESLALAGVHKQYANRVLEPYLYGYGVISATEWENFFNLRCHPDAQPEFQELAYAVREALDKSEPVERGDCSVLRDHEADWHLPYVSDMERRNFSLGKLLRMSAARCAWVSYKPFDESQGTDLEKVQRTFAKLVGQPMHASPMEHVATPYSVSLPGFAAPSNFRRWVQWRHVLEAHHGQA